MKPFKPGDWVALYVSKGIAPSRGFVGEVQVADETGIRIELFDWLQGPPRAYDLFVPWKHIENALVDSGDHLGDAFKADAVNWLTLMGEKE